MSRKMRREQLAKKISLALMAGMVTYAPVACGMPVQDGTAAGVSVVTSGNVMNIAGAVQNNIINWKDFSIAQGETVNFDAKNYANIVTGSATSFINGAMNGGGDIYLINPNGVIFGKTAEVNVGNLYVSTQGGLENKSYDDVASAVTSPITTKVASDVVNLGKIQANKVEVVGNNIRFLNAANITKDGTSALTGADVKVTAQGYIHVGHEGAPSASGYTANKSVTEYQLVHNVPDLQNIKNNPSANYMLADDINKGGANISTFTPIAGFTGNFDGMFHTVNNLTIKSSGSAGLFASASNGRIENVGLVNVKVTGGTNKPTGGLVGEASNEVIRNVYNTGTGSVNGSKKYTGGLVGKATGTTIETSYNTVASQGAGILGTAAGTVSISNVYNAGSVFQYSFVYYDYDATNLSIKDSYTTTIGKKYADEIAGKTHFTNLHGIPPDADDRAKQASTYAGWSISDVGGVQIDASGNVKKPVWRIYAGKSTPLLTAFFKGTVQADYDFSMGSLAGKNQTEKPKADYETNAYWTDYASSKNGNVVTTYNGNKVEVDNVAWNNGVDSGLIQYNEHSKNADRKRDGSDSYALFSSGQQGYDIAGGNFTIEKRKLIADAAADVVPTKEYDGTAKVNVTGNITGAFQAATGMTGIVAGDNVTLTGTVTGSFYKSKGEWQNWQNGLISEAQAESKTVGEGKYARLNYSGLSLAGADVNNYDLSFHITGNIESEKGIITPRSLTVKLNNETGADKVYDGTTAVTAAGYGWDNVALDKTRILGGEKVNLIHSSDGVVYDDKNAGTGKTLSYKGIKLTGADAGNYRLVNASGEVIYNNTVVGTKINADDGAALQATGAISRRKIDMAQTLREASREYNGESTYDGAIQINTQTAFAAAGTSGTGIIKYQNGSVDDIGFTRKAGTTGTFKDAGGNATIHAGGANAAKTVAYDLVISGADAGNYELVDGTALSSGANISVSGKGTITKAKLTAVYNSGAALLERTYNGESKVVDGTEITEDRVINSLNVTGWKKNDKDTLGNTVAKGADYVTNGAKDGHVAFANGVQKKDVLYTLAELDDYVFTDGAGHTIEALVANDAGRINQKELTVKFADITKTYDGTTKLTANNLNTVKTGSTIDGVIASDVGKIALNTDALTGAYKSANVADYAGGNKNGAIYQNVTVTDNTGHHDYAVPQGDLKGNGKITPKVISGAADLDIEWGSITKIYDGDVLVKGATGAESAVYGTGQPTVNKTNFIEKLYAKGVSGDGIAFNVSKAVYDNKNAGDGKAVTYTLVVNKDQFGSNYDVSGITGSAVTFDKATTGTITPKAITAVISNANTTKTYDGNANVCDSLGNVLSGNSVIALDGLVTGDTNNSSAVYYYTETGVKKEAKNASDNPIRGAEGILYTIAIADGNGGGNYKITNVNGNQLTGTGRIDRADLALTFANQTKDYDTTTALTAPINVTQTGLKGTDGLDATKIQGVYGLTNAGTWKEDANAGDKAVRYTNVDQALGDNYGNYNVSYTTPGGSEAVKNGIAYGKGTINKLTLTPGMVTSNIDTVTKTYDGTANVSHYDGTGMKNAEDYVGLTVTINGKNFVWKNSQEKTYFKNVTGTFQDGAPGDAKNAGNNKTVKYTVDLSDELANNINFDSSALSGKLTTTGNTIEKRKVTVGVELPLGKDAIDKVYDGNNNVDASLLTLTYDRDANIHTSKTGILASDYNGGLGVAVSMTGSKYTSKDANYDPRNQSTHDGSNQVQLTFSLDNNLDGNYELTNPTGTAAGNIEKRALTVDFAGSVDPNHVDTKTYDGNRNLANLASSYLALNTANVQGSDTVNLTGAIGQYDAKDAGDRTVTFNGFTLDNGNYYVSNVLSGQGTITKKNIDVDKIHLKGSTKLEKIYDGSKDATSLIIGKTLTSDGFVAGDDVSLTATKATYNDPNVPLATIVTYDGVALHGDDAKNYTFTGTTLTGDGKITPKTIHVVATGTVQGKVYDGKALSLDDLKLKLNPSERVTKEGASGEDDVTLLNPTITATKNGVSVAKVKNAGTYELSYGAFVLDGADKANYALEQPTNLPSSVTITKKSLTATIDATSRDYKAGNVSTGNVNAAITGFVTDADFGLTASDTKNGTLVGTYGTWDTDFTQDGNVSRTTNTPHYVAVDGKNYGHKALKYDGFDAALAGAIGADAAENYYIGDVTGKNGSAVNIDKDSAGLVKTAYFNEAAKMGYLKPIAVLKSSIKESWDNDIKKVYDGTDAVNDPLKNMHLFHDINGNGRQDAGEGNIVYTLDSAKYNSKNVAGADPAKQVTYTATINKDKVLAENPNYEFEDAAFASQDYKLKNGDTYNGKTYKVGITAREVYVDFADGHGVNDVAKTYDGTNLVLPPDWTPAQKQAYLNAALKLRKATEATQTDAPTGIVKGENVTLNTSGMTVVYKDPNGNVAYDADGNVIAQTVNYSGFTLNNNDDGNYVLKSADKTDTLSGTGTIKPQEIQVGIVNPAIITKEYDGTKTITTGGTIGNISAGGAVTATYTINGQDVKVARGTVTNDGVGNLTYQNGANTVTMALSLDGSAEYDDKNVHLDADGKVTHGLGVSYYLKWDNQNFKLVHTANDDVNISDSTKLSATLRGENMGTITPREITIGNLYAEKEYDGTTAVKGLNGANTTVNNVVAADLIGTNVVDMLGLKAEGNYDKKDAADNETDEFTLRTVNYTNVSITNANYTFANDKSSVLTKDIVMAGNGKITRKEITAMPTPIMTKPGEEPQFGGTFAGFIGADGATAATDFVWDSPDYPAYVSTKGEYDVYAYYNGKTDGYYGNNYKFSKNTGNKAWKVGYKINPSDPNFPFHPSNDIYKAIVADTDFIPDDKAYNRASHDDDMRHFGREAVIGLQHKAAGVNLGDGGVLAGWRALTDLEARGDVLNLDDGNGSASAFGSSVNEMTAEDAAVEAGMATPTVDSSLFVPGSSASSSGNSAAGFKASTTPTTETAGISGIDIMTAESEDEDEEEARNRSALLARTDRDMHIGIETVGSGVNVPSMIG